MRRPRQNSLRLCLVGLQQVRKPDPVQHFRAHPVHDSKGDIRAVLGGIDMHPEWPLAEWRVYHLDDRIGHRRSIGIGRHDSGEGFQDFFAQPFGRSRLILGETRGVGRPSRMREVVGER